HRLELVDLVPTIGELLTPSGHSFLCLFLCCHTVHFLLLPVWRAATDPTVLPGEVPRATVFGRPVCWWPPPPNGWSMTFIATPRTRGQLDAVFAILWYLLPAFTNGLSTRPPPATMPMVARQRTLNHLVLPLGILTPTRSPILSTTTACTPEARTNLPPSLGRDSMLQI